MPLLPLPDLTWQPVGPPLPILGGAAVMAVLAVAAYWRTIRERPIAGSILCAMRVLSIAMIAVLLLGPSALRPASLAGGRPPLSILLDTSESMLTSDDAGVCRIESVRAKWLDDQTLAALARDFDVELSGFDEEVRPLPRSQLSEPAAQLARGRATHLADSVSNATARVRRGQDGAAMLVLSDGRDSRDAAIQPAAALAKSRELPVFTVLVGRDSKVNDVAVLAVPMQDYLLPGEAGSILVKVYQSGLETAAATLTVKQGDKRQTFPVSFQGKPLVELQVPVKHDEAGQYEYTVELEPLEGETTASNNTTTVFCDVQRKRIKVLLIEGSPYWDTKFLAQSLRKDDRIELVQISQLSKSKRETIVTRSEGDSPQIPKTADDWSKYDVVILGKNVVDVVGLDSATHLIDFVTNRGGHLVFARGETFFNSRKLPAAAQRAGDSDPIVQMHKAFQSLEPVESGFEPLRNTRIALAPAGRLSQWLSGSKMGVNIDQALARLPGLETVPAGLREKPAAVVLARSVPINALDGAPGPPAIVQMNVGRGSVLAITGDGLWRWSLLDDEQQQFVGLYDAFWSNLVRWMAMGGDFAPGQQVSLKLARTTSRLGDALAIDVVCKHLPQGGELPKLAVTDAGGRTEEILLERRPGREPRFQASLQPQSTGVYRVALRSPGLTPAEQEQRFSVYDVNEERLNTLVNAMPLKVLAEHSGGEFYEIDERDRFLQRLKRHLVATQAPPQTEYIWDDWRVMVALLSWFGIEWIVRRRMGLL